MRREPTTPSSRSISDQQSNCKEINRLIPIFTDNVRNFDHELSEHTQRIKTIQEQLKEKAESTAEYAVVEQLTAQLKEAKEKLKYKLLNMPGYNDLAEKLADEKDAKRSAELDISDFLLGYFKETGERQIELAEKDAREVILKGKLGKPQAFQTNLFAGGGKS